MKTLALVALFAVALPLSARADEEAIAQHLESPRTFLLELHGSRFRPEIDSHFTGPQPYNDVFGNKAQWLFGGEIDWELWQAFGTLSAGFAADYGAVFGHGIVALTGEPGPDLTALKTLPMRLLLSYRFDWLAERYGIPVIPYGKAGLAYTVWWITNGANDIATFTPEGATSADKAIGGKLGYQLSGGLALRLNFLDPVIGREADDDFGINSTSAFVEYTRITGNNFGSTGLDLSDSMWVFGLQFEF